MLGNFCGRFPPFQISLTILNHCGMTHTLLSGKQGTNIVIVLTHSEWNPSLGLQTGQNSAHYVWQKISSAELGLVLIGSSRVSSTHLKHVNAMLLLSTWMLDGWMHQRWFQKAFGGVLCIFTNFVLMSVVPRFWEVTVGGCHWSTWCDDPRSSVFWKPVINISGGCFPAYSIVSLSFSLRFRSVSCLHHVWATKILPLSLNGVPDHILQFGCRRPMEDFHTVCRSELCFCRLLNSPVAQSTLLKGLGLQEGAFKSAFILCAFPNTACFLLQKPCMAFKGNLYKQS